MGINWKVRVRNPLFWVQLACAVLAPMLAGVGLQGSDVTSWPILLDAIVSAIANPVVVVAMAGAAWGVINDPTVKGPGDSPAVLARDEPLEVATTAKHAKE